MKRLFAIALLVVMAGCKKIDCEQAAVDRAHRRYHLREASKRSAAYADSVWGTTNRPESPDSSGVNP